MAIHAGTSVTKYLILLRGINVGGKNKVPMAPLRELLEELGYSGVSTYIASGNVILQSRGAPDGIKRQIETALPRRFRLDSELIAVRVLSHAELRAVVDHKPRGFGEQPGTYHSDAIFLIGIDARDGDGGIRPAPGGGSRVAGGRRRSTRSASARNGRRAASTRRSRPRSTSR